MNENTNPTIYLSGWVNHSDFNQRYKVEEQRSFLDQSVETLLLKEAERGSYFSKTEEGIGLCWVGDTISMIDYKLEKELTAISGESITDLHLDFDALSMADLKTAQRIAKMVADSSSVDVMSTSPRLDPNVRIGIAWVAAIKGTKGIQVNDVLSLSLKDAVCLSEVALSDYLFL